MITHNGTYLLHATHHGMPIVAATMGGKIVFGSKWLLPATQLAIVAAFGSAEGTEVIAKTNDYLNRIATTDPQRALLLAGFINEDPMLVCSLVETSKTRWLVGDGKAYVDTGLLPLKDEMVELKYMQVKAQPSGGGYSIFGCRVSGSYYTLQQIGSTIRTSVGNSWIITNIVTELNKEVTIARSNNNVYENGELIYSSTAAFNPPTLPMYLFTMNSYGTPEQFDSELLIGEAKFGERAYYLPFRRNGQMELLDILTGNLATRVGTFTEQITTTPA